MRRGVVELSLAELQAGFDLLQLARKREQEDGGFKESAEVKDDSLYNKFQAGLTEAQKNTSAAQTAAEKKNVLARVLLSEDQAEQILDEIGPEFSAGSQAGVLRTKIKAFLEKLKI
eukprot:gb/GEZN01024960.1/.p1 GENE.gb/GEZN01024960.1/~~gb/GEZN01024960.1/.p1  ORF type:complete len:116 (-),score=31.16 gb/GEZN01024960.1/:184-531(-)